MDNYDVRIDMRVVVPTGAEISAESGIRTFRANDGVWEIIELRMLRLCLGINRVWFGDFTVEGNCWMLIQTPRMKH